jgi:hypothetical protein
MPFWHERQLLKNYKSKAGESLLTGIVSMQDNYFSSGGLVDRIKGIVSGYCIARELGLDFHIFFSDEQDPLVSIISKESVHLIFERNQLDFSKKVSTPVVLYNYKPDGLSGVKQKMKKKRQLHLYSNVDLLYLFHNDEKVRKKIWSDMFKRVFNPDIHGFMTAIGTVNSGSIGIHLRFIGLLGDFKDLRQQVLSEDLKMRMLDWCREKIYKIASQHDDPIIVVSDSAFFLKSIMLDSKANGLLPKLVLDPVSIGHTALENAAGVFEKAVIDFNSLSSCKKVYQLRYGKMHNSDFSRYASMVNSNEFELVESDATK